MSNELFEMFENFQEFFVGHRCLSTSSESFYISVEMMRGDHFLDIGKRKYGQMSLYLTELTNSTENAHNNWKWPFFICKLSGFTSKQIFMRHTERRRSINFRFPIGWVCVVGCRNQCSCIYLKFIDCAIFSSMNSLRFPKAISMDARYFLTHPVVCVCVCADRCSLDVKRLIRVLTYTVDN